MPATLMSVTEFELPPEVSGRQELLQGELITLPPEKLSRNRVAQALFKLLGFALDASHVHMEAGCQMSPDTWLKPDVSVTWPDQPVKNDHLQGSPMIAVKVASPGNPPRRSTAKSLLT